MATTYQYRRTPKRWHRIIVEDGRRYQVERCNLDDAAASPYVDEEPPDDEPRCFYCFEGKPDQPDNPAQPQSDDRPWLRRLATASGAIVGAIIISTFVGTTAGVLVSPCPTAAHHPSPSASVTEEPSWTPSQSESGAPSATPTLSSSPSPDTTMTASPTLSASPSVVPTPSPSEPTPSASTPSPSPSPAPTMTPVPTVTPTPTEPPCVP